MARKEKAVLRPAYAWECPTCKRQNFARAPVAEMSPEDLAKLKEEHGLHPWADGDFTYAVREVECPNCEGRFRVAI